MLNSPTDFDMHEVFHVVINAKFTEELW